MRNPFKLLSECSILALCAIGTRKTEKREMCEKMNFRILVAGGSLFAKEAGIHSSCELLTISSSGDVNSEPFPSMNIPRRGASCFVSANTDNPGVWIIGGCTESSQVDSAEYFDVSRLIKKETGNWRLLFEFLNVGRSCFMAAPVRIDAKDRTMSDDCLLVLGGWDGRQCLSSAERIRVKVDRVNNNSSATPAVDTRPSPGAVRTNATRDYKSVSTADLISPIKNGCALVVPDGKERGNRVSLLLVGGWDGKRTLDTVFRYTVPSDFLSEASSTDMQFDRLLPYPVECHACVLQTNEAIFIIGGFDGLRVLDTIVRVSLTDDSITVLPTKLAVARECHCAEILMSDRDNQLLVVFGGWNGFEALRSVEIFRVTNRYPYLSPVTVKETGLLQARNRACSVVLPAAI